MTGHWRFHRSFKLLPGVRLNVNKRSVSVTAGSRRGGPHVTASSTGDLTSSVGLPGSGLSYRWRTRAARAVGGRAGRNVIVLLLWAVLIGMFIGAFTVVRWFL